MFLIDYLNPSGIEECFDCFGEMYLVFLNIRKFFVRIPFKLHDLTLSHQPSVHHCQDAVMLL